MKRVWILGVLITVSVTGLGYVHPFGNPRVERGRPARYSRGPTCPRRRRRCW